MKTTVKAAIYVASAENLMSASAAIREVLGTPSQAPETLQEAMRTLAMIGKPPVNNTISGCTFLGTEALKPPRGRKARSKK